MHVRALVQLVALHVVSAQCALNRKYAAGVAVSAAIPVDLSGFYNSRAFASGPDDANMDGSGSQFSLLHGWNHPSSQMPPLSFCLQRNQLQLSVVS